jgi:hypothetical protein
MILPLPRSPAGAARVWRCTGCPKLLGIVRGEQVEIVHQRRRILAPLPCVQQCDDCKTINMVRDPSDLPPA